MNESAAFVPTDEVVRALVEAAVLAPSADNRHHFGIVRDARGLTIRADREYIEGEVPHRRLLILISFGAVVENLRLRLTEHGFTFRPRWFPDDSDPSVVVRMQWDDVFPVAAADGLARHIAARHTNRRFFRGPALTAAEHAAIAMAAAGADVRLEWFDRPPTRRAMLRLVRTAETARFATPALHAELFGSIAFDAGWNATVAEHLSPGSLEVEAPLRLPFAALRRWPLMRAANRLGAHRVFGLRAGDLPARTAPHLCAITSTLPPEAAALAAGVAFQRVWLAAEGAGIALQPMVASAILAIHADPRHGLGRPVFERLRDGWRALVGDAVPIVVFRMGRASAPAVRSGRRPVDDYLR